MAWNRIIAGHALDVLKTIPDCSINMCITSPPYWGLRDYNTNPATWNDSWTGELGAEPNFNMFINHLCDIFDEVKRVLKKDGTCWVNLGDTYGRSCLLNNLNKNYSKSLLLIPFRFAVEMMNRGWIVRNVVIWHKPNGTPESAKDRFTNDFEYLFFFTKSKKYYFEQQYEPFAESTLLYSQKCRKNNNSVKTSSYKGLTPERLKKIREMVLNNTSKGRNKRSVWNISTVGYKGAHFATYPYKLIETPIKAGCPEDGIVLDPFIGSGTTAVVAEKLKRNWLGIELNSEYTKLANDRIEQERNKDGAA